MPSFTTQVSGRPGLLGGKAADRAGDLGGRQHLGEKAVVDVECVHSIQRPPLADGVVTGLECVAPIGGGGLPDQVGDQQIGGVGQPADAFGVGSEPGHLREAERRLDRQPQRKPELGRRLVGRRCLGGGPLIGVGQCRSDRQSVTPEGNDRPRGGGDADRLNVRGGIAEIGSYPAQRLRQRRCPRTGILLGPARLGAVGLGQRGLVFGEDPVHRRPER